MTHLATVLSLLSLAACGGSTAVVDEVPTDSADTGAGEDIGGDTSDSGDPAETGDTAESDPDLAWDLTGDFAGTSFSFVSLTPGDFLMADILVEVPVSDRVELTLEPPEDYLEATDVPGMFVAFFVGAVHEDDGDDKWDPDEAWFGSSTFLSAYLDGVIPPEVSDLGLHQGWNALELGRGEGIFVGDPLSQPLPVAFSGSLTMSGTHDDTIDDDARVTTLAASAFAGTATDALDDSAIVDGEWSLRLSGEPPADHYADIDGNGSVEAVELLMAYADSNENESFDLSSDHGLGFACVDGLPLFGWWIEPSPDLTELMNISGMGGSVGWNGIIVDDVNGSRVAEATELESAVVSANCTLD